MRGGDALRTAKALVRIRVSPVCGVSLGQITEQSGIVFVMRRGEFERSDGRGDLPQLQQGQAEQAARAGMSRRQHHGDTAAFQRRVPVAALQGCAPGLQRLVQQHGLRRQCNHLFLLSIL